MPEEASGYFLQQIHCALYLQDEASIERLEQTFPSCMAPLHCCCRILRDVSEARQRRLQHLSCPHIAAFSHLPAS